MSRPPNLAATKERYLKHRQEAMKQAETSMRAHLKRDFEIRDWGARALEVMSKSWVNRPLNWDWQEIMRRHHDPDRFAFTIWAAGNRLAAQGLALTTRVALNFRFFEGDPRDDCPLKGVRIAIGLEACAMYAQLIGKAELRVSPTNSSLESLYQDIYGFHHERPTSGEPYFVRKL